MDVLSVHRERFQNSAVLEIVLSWHCSQETHHHWFVCLERANYLGVVQLQHD